MDFKNQYNLYLGAVENLKDEYLSVPDIPQKNVFEAMRYAVCGGGKRVRPVLTMAVADLFGADAEDAARVGLAVECIHNYSLIHDDLPCMDDDDMRRGRATCHKVFGESTALLAGDGLLNLAFEILSDTAAFKSVTCESLVAIIRRLSVASGVYGMIGGQVVDLENENRSDVTIDELEYMHGGKTGALIRAAAVCGCMTAGLAENDEKVWTVDSFAEKLGLAFQIKDDILDVVGDEELIGKPIGSDRENGKNTFVTLLGLEEAQTRLSDITASAINTIVQLGDGAWFLNELAVYLLGRDY